MTTTSMTNIGPLQACLGIVQGGMVVPTALLDRFIL